MKGIFVYIFEMIILFSLLILCSIYSNSSIIPYIIISILNLALIVEAARLIGD